MTTALDQTRVRVMKTGGWLSVVAAIWTAGLLLFAAVMKWEQLPVIERMGEGWLHQPWMAAGQIVMEAGLALWLTAEALGAAGKGRAAWSRRAAMVVFSVFACVATYEGMVGEESCGCFGEFKVSPWLTVGLDLATVALLGVLHGRFSVPKHTEKDGPVMQKSTASVGCSVRTRVLIYTGLLALVISLTVYRVAERTAMADDGLLRAGGLVILEPESWIGRRLPLTAYLQVIEGGTVEQLMAGLWRIVIYSADCDHCRSVIPRLAASLKRQSSPQDVQWAFLEMPTGARESLLLAGEYALKMRLTDDEQWFATTPTIVELQDGVVTSAAEGKAADAIFEVNNDTSTMGLRRVVVDRGS